MIGRSDDAFSMSFSQGRLAQGDMVTPDRTLLATHGHRAWGEPILPDGGSGDG